MLVNVDEKCTLDHLKKTKKIVSKVGFARVCV